MKKSIGIIAITLFFSSANAKLQFPTKNSDGFSNVNDRKTYEYSVYADQEIWHEFGRPYWKAKTVPVKALSQKPVEKPVVLRASAVEKPINFQDTFKLDIKFNVYKADIKKEYTKQLNKLGEILSKHSTVALEVHGHTDATGSNELNSNLSNERAVAVKNYLVQKYSLEPSRITPIGHGAAKPLNDNETLAARKENRRVMIKFK